MADIAKQSEVAAHPSSCHQDYVGKNVTELPKPAAILDVAKVRKHCSSMLNAARRLGVEFRAHVKTHKTIQLTKLQLGDSTEDAKLVVSTVAELEHLLPLLQSFVRSGRRVNIVYGMPLPPSQVPRIATAAHQLGPGSLTFIIDHPSQLGALGLFRELAGFPGGAFIKIDTGYHRAGLPAASINKEGLVQQISLLEAQDQVKLVGLYSHSSLSYQGATSRQALDALNDEISSCVEALGELRKYYTNERVLTISVGASPQVTATQDLLDREVSGDESANKLLDHLETFSSGEIEGFKTSLEVHAGVYSVLDLQQLATNSRVSLGSYEDEIALSVIAEVASVYNNGERQQPEVLIAVGTLGLGREPCQGYRGWGVVSSQSTPSLATPQRRLIVSRISQEHAILAWETLDGEDTTKLPPIPLEVGQSVFVYPNHACVTGAMYASYFVVDSSEQSSPHKVIDVWQRASGW
ncbi:putative serine dehydratase domain-containing protein [Dactylonectria macrodidyma]|uniref:Serine dehydratase domain-containing protein n=1 Tax=Dactylonectria macrodidyma TaxID=307937 RepID=A0A9P9F9T8_9HYPO|nr:putative serine dehydratase domain-containing protein [Dactylonectria macrodidyma]